MASIMRFNEDGTRDFIDYGPAPENERDRGMPMRRIVSVLHTARLVNTNLEIGRCGCTVFYVALVEKSISFAYHEAATWPSASTWISLLPPIEGGGEGGMMLVSACRLLGSP